MNKSEEKVIKSMKKSAKKAKRNLVVALIDGKYVYTDTHRMFMTNTLHDGFTLCSDILKKRIRDKMYQCYEQTNSVVAIDVVGLKEKVSESKAKGEVFCRYMVADFVVVNGSYLLDFIDGYYTNKVYYNGDNPFGAIVVGDGIIMPMK